MWRTDADIEEKCQLLKKEVKKMLLAAADEPQQQLNSIDDIQRSGVAYHFEREIDAALHHMNATFHEFIAIKNGDDLHITALCFRLLRQNGYNVSSAKSFVSYKNSFMNYDVSDFLGDCRLIIPG